MRFRIKKSIISLLVGLITNACAIPAQDLPLCPVAPAEPGCVWKQAGKSVEGSLVEGEWFGDHAAISADGKTFVVGTPSTGSSNRGRARIYRWHNETWLAIGEIDGTDSGEWLGEGIALSGDGNTVAIGSAGYGVQDDGIVRVYEYDATALSWVQRGQMITGSVPHGHFGESLDLSVDGTILAVGAKEGLDGPGYVKVYQYHFNYWIQLGNTMRGYAPGDYFGEVSLSADGTRIAIGAEQVWNEEDDALGYVQVYSYNNDTKFWDSIGLQLSGHRSERSFGRTVSLSPDGSTLAIGSAVSVAMAGVDGIVDVYRYNESIWDWSQLGETISETGFGFGQHVSVSENGTTLVVGNWVNDAPVFTSDGRTQVHIYKYIGCEGWEQFGDPLDAGMSDQTYGFGVSYSKNGHVSLVIGGGEKLGDNYGGRVDEEPLGFAAVYMINTSAPCSRNGPWSEDGMLSAKLKDYPLGSQKENNRECPEENFPDESFSGAYS